MKQIEEMMSKLKAYCDNQGIKVDMDAFFKKDNNSHGFNWKILEKKR